MYIFSYPLIHCFFALFCGIIIILKIIVLHIHIHIYTDNEFIHTCAFCRIYITDPLHILAPS